MNTLVIQLNITRYSLEESTLHYIACFRNRQIAVSKDLPATVNVVFPLTILGTEIQW